jgi:hypothetical protein
MQKGKEASDGTSTNQLNGATVWRSKQGERKEEF